MNSCKHLSICVTNHLCISIWPSITIYKTIYLSICVTSYLSIYLNQLFSTASSSIYSIQYTGLFLITLIPWLPNNIIQTWILIKQIQENHQNTREKYIWKKKKEKKKNGKFCKLQEDKTVLENLKVILSFVLYIL